MRPQVRVLLWGLVAAGLALSVLPRALHAGSLTELNDTKQRLRGAVKRLFEDMDNTKGGKPDG